jgi:hypothetical protein
MTLREAELADRGLLRQLLTDYLFEFDGTRPDGYARRAR